MSSGSTDDGLAKTDSFLLLWRMENGRQIRTQLAEKRLKLDSSSLAYAISPTRPRPAQCVSRRSLKVLKSGLPLQKIQNLNLGQDTRAN